MHEFHERPIRNDALNWRRTAVGRVQDERARPQAKRRIGPSQKGMDAGHAMSAEGGEDPRKSKHMFPQDPYQNQSGTWRNSERAARQIARDNPNRKFREQVIKSHDPKEAAGTTFGHSVYRR